MSYSIIDRAVFGPRHAKRSKGLKIAAKGSAIAALLAATGFAGAGMAAMTPAPSPAAFAGQSATAVLNVNLTSYHQVNWEQRTCSAFATWQRHPTSGNLDAIMADSFRVTWKYVGEDAADLYSDVRAGKDDSTAVQYFFEDCHNGYGS